MTRHLFPELFGPDALRKDYNWNGGGRKDKKELCKRRKQIIEQYTKHFFPEVRSVSSWNNTVISAINEGLRRKYVPHGSMSASSVSHQPASDASNSAPPPVFSSSPSASCAPQVVTASQPVVATSTSVSCVSLVTASHPVVAMPPSASCAPQVVTASQPVVAMPPSAFCAPTVVAASQPVVAMPPSAFCAPTVVAASQPVVATLPSAPCTPPVVATPPSASCAPPVDVASQPVIAPPTDSTYSMYTRMFGCYYPSDSTAVGWMTEPTDTFEEEQRYA